MRERACARGRCQGGEQPPQVRGQQGGAGKGRGRHGIVCSGTRTKGPRVHRLIQNLQIGVHFLFELNPPPKADRTLLPRLGPVRFLRGFGRGRLTVPERAESGFPHVAGEARGSARCGSSGVGMGAVELRAFTVSGDMRAPRRLGGSREEMIGRVLQSREGGRKQLRWNF